MGGLHLCVRNRDPSFCARGVQTCEADTQPGAAGAVPLPLAHTATSRSPLQQTAQPCQLPSSLKGANGLQEERGRVRGARG